MLGIRILETVIEATVRGGFAHGPEEEVARATCGCFGNWQVEAFNSIRRLSCIVVAVYVNRVYGSP